MGVIEFLTVAHGGMIVARPSAERTEPVNIACAATVAEDAQVVGENREGDRWRRKPLVNLVSSSPAMTMT